MDILFFMRHQGHVRNFETTIAGLAERGHSVHIAFAKRIEGERGEPTQQCLDSLQARFPTVTSSMAPRGGRARWDRFGITVRRSLDYLRYLGPEFRHAEKLRARGARNAPLLLDRFGRSPLARAASTRRLLVSLLRRIDRALPVSRTTLNFLESRRPDLVLVTPLVDGGSQPTYLRAAHALGIPAGLCVCSWDNLTSSGLIHGDPDFVTLWNEQMKREAVELHEIASDRVFPTGAQSYDHWFTWQPSTSREEFCSGAGLDPAYPFLLYMCSSRFIAGSAEPAFVKRWIAALRQRPGLEHVGVLVRPHPQVGDAWNGCSLEQFGNVGIWKINAEPATPEGKREYFDSIHHAAAVVGINTSALVESAVVGRPVLSVVSPEFEQTQTGTLHFGLIGGDDGALIVAHSMEEHLEHIVTAIGDPSFGSGRRSKFLRTFVRPKGLDVPASEHLIDVLEHAAEVSKRPRSETAVDHLIRVLVFPATFLQRPGGRRSEERQNRVRSRF